MEFQKKVNKANNQQVYTGAETFAELDKFKVIKELTDRIEKLEKSNAKKTQHIKLLGDRLNTLYNGLRARGIKIYKGDKK